MMLNAKNIERTPLPNGWQQVSFTLDAPDLVTVGCRLRCGQHTLAPWRKQGAKIDCLVLPNADEADFSPYIDWVSSIKIDVPETQRPRLIVGEGLGIADVLFYVAQKEFVSADVLVILSHDSFPCQIKPARFLVPCLPELIAACPLLEDWGIANRLVSSQGLVGCFDGGLEQFFEAIRDDAMCDFVTLCFNGE